MTQRLRFGKLGRFDRCQRLAFRIFPERDTPISAKRDATRPRVDISCLPQGSLQCLLLGSFSHSRCLRQSNDWPLARHFQSVTGLPISAAEGIDGLLTIVKGSTVSCVASNC